MATNWTNTTVDADLPANADTQLPEVDKGLESTLPSTTVETVPSATTPAGAQTFVTPDITTDITEPTIPTAVEALEAGITRTGEQIEDIPLAAADRLIEDEATKDEALLQAKEFAEEREGIIEEKDVAIAETEAQIAKLSQDRAVRDAEALTSVKDAEILKAQLIVEEQRLKNQIAEEKAETKIETAKQQATWAFNKLGLGFSSGIILEVQRIATRGATALALVKITGAKLLADTQIAVAKLEQDYSTEINRTIDKYTDLWINNKQNSIQRIANVQNNLLLNSKQKEDAINKIKAGFKSETRKIEDDMRNDQERLADKQVQQARVLEGQVVALQNQEKAAINNQFNSGSWFTLTERQKWIQLAKAGLGLEEGSAMEKTAFSKTITQEVNASLGKNVTLTWSDRGAIQTLATSYMEGWLVFAEANKRATLDYIDSVPRLARVKKIQDAKLKAALTPKTGTKTIKWKPQTKINELGQFISVDPVTWVSSVILDAEWNPTLAPKKEKSALDALIEAKLAESFK